MPASVITSVPLQQESAIPFRFVHTADIHLDSPLRSLALRDPALAERAAVATRTAFVRIIDLCLDEAVDALLIAGDLYDGEQTSMKTALFLASQFKRLHAAGIRVFIIRGNHDAASRLTRELSFDDNVHIFQAKAETVMITSGGGKPIAIHGLSFRDPHVSESLLSKYRPAVTDAINIGLMHTSLDGSLGHDPYAPCRSADLAATGFNYWALGHVHKRAVINGPTTIVMAGMPQGRHVNEAGPKSASLVTIGDDGTVEIEERVTSVAEFARVSVNAEGMKDWPDLLAEIAHVLRNARTGAGSDELIIRLSCIGKTKLAWRMRRDIDILKAEADSSAQGIGHCHVESVETLCEMPDEPTVGGDPVYELKDIVLRDVLQSPAFLSEVDGISADLIRKLPAELRNMLGQDADETARTLQDLSREGAAYVLATLQGTSGEGTR